MKENEKNPLGRDLTQFGNALSDFDLENPSHPGEWKQIDLVGGLIAGTGEFAQRNQVYLQQAKHYLMFGFDAAITAMTILNEFIFVIPNFFNAVVTYIAQLVYNALEAYLRLGVHVLVVPPDFADSSYDGYPTTTIHEQAKNVYKKFYDTSDPYLPYQVPFEKKLDEQLIQSGHKYRDKIEQFMRKKTVDGYSLNKAWFGGSDRNETLRSDFQDFDDSIRNLSRPAGVYEAIFLYFSLDYRSNTQNIRRFLESIASFANLFQIESLTGLHEDFESMLSRGTRRKIHVLTTMKLDMPTKKDIEHSKVDSYSRKLVTEDKELAEFYIVEADPLVNMPKEHFERIEEFVKSEIELTKAVMLEGEMEQGEAAIMTIREQLRNRSHKYLILKRLLEESKIAYSFYRSKELIATFFQGTDWSDTEGVLGTVQNHTALSEVKDFLNKDDFSVGKEMAHVREVISMIEEFDIHRPTGDPFDDNRNDYLEGRIKQLQEKLDDISNTWINAEDAADITPIHFKSQNKLNDYLHYEQELHDYEEFLDEEAVRIYKENFQKLSDSVASKEEQVENLRKKIDKTKDGIPADKLEDETLTRIVYHHRNYKEKNNSLFNNHLKQYYTSSNHTDLITSVMNWYNGAAVDPKLIPAENFVYEFTIEKPGVSFNNIQTGMYVHVYHKDGKNYKFIGDGFVTDDHGLSLEEGGDGNWLGINFSDLIGTTGLIKALQKKVKAFQNMFTPNDNMFAEMIRYLQRIRKRVVELIDIIDHLLNLLNLSINFTGSTWGKYCREHDMDAYDKLAANLTDTSIFPNSPSVKSFRPSNNSTIKYYLDKIREIDPEEANSIKVEIDSAYLKTNGVEDRIKKASEGSQQPTLTPDLNGYMDGLWLDNEAFDQAVKVKNFITSEVDRILVQGDHKLSKDLGSALFSNVKEMDFVSEEKLKENRQNNKIAVYKTKLYSELSLIERKLSNEFGFSLVFLSYLPKGMPWYPIEWLAECWGLKLNTSRALEGRPDHGTVPSQPVLDELDTTEIEKKLSPDKTEDYLKSLFTTQSRRMSPAGGITRKASPINTQFRGHRVTDSSNFTWLNNQSETSDKFEVISTAPDYKFRIKGALGTNLHGVRTQVPLSLDKILENAFHTYRYEIELSVELDTSFIAAQSLNIRQIPNINKIDVHMGYFIDNGIYDSYEKAFEVNDEMDDILNFGNRKFKKFKSQFVGVINEISKQNIMPYLLIGYRTNFMRSTSNERKPDKNIIKRSETNYQLANQYENIDMSSVIFTIKRSRLYFYRTH